MPADGEAHDDAVGLRAWLDARGERADMNRSLLSYFASEDTWPWDEEPIAGRYGAANVGYVFGGEIIRSVLEDYHGLREEYAPSPGATAPSPQSCRACYTAPPPAVAEDICRRPDGSCSGECDERVGEWVLRERDCGAWWLCRCAAQTGDWQHEPDEDRCRGCLCWRPPLLEQPEERARYARRDGAVVAPLPLTPTESAAWRAELRRRVDAAQAEEPPALP